MSKPDITYVDEGLFVRFMPETPAGEAAWNTMAAENGGACFLTIHLAAILQQLRAAGYTVRKQRREKSDGLSDDALLAALLDT